MTEPNRPDPDALLARVNAEEARERRTRFKVFFGFAPGVGKTYRMLQVARDLVAEGVDVVIGAVETHGRYDTAGLALGLEVLPRRSLPYRGRVLEEFDLDAALARRPKILLLDELAHANAPGSRHEKRWQDVLELLEAGIEVYTTLNVQHVESLNDVVAQITHVQVRETVPDSVLERADETELVDIAPEELLERLREGKVYFPEQAALAREHFFRRGNLLALRELALRRMAERVDADVLAFREAQGVARAWPTAERVLVCVGPAPDSARIVRAGRRIAAGLRAPWIAAAVEATARPPLSEEDRERLEAHLRLAESLGAVVVRLSGLRVPDAVLEFARRRNVTRIVLGKPRHPRWRDRLRGSLVDEIIRGSGEIEVHVLSGAEGGVARPAAAEREPASRPREYLSAVGIVAVTTAMAALVRATLDAPDVEMLFLLAVLVVALTSGRRASILAAVLAVVSYDFFFVPPPYTLDVSDARYFLTFAMMLVVGVVIGTLTLRLREQQRAAVVREQRTSTLFALSRALGAAMDAPGVGAACARAVSEAFDCDAVFLAAKGRDALEPLACSRQGASLAASELAVARRASVRAKTEELRSSLLASVSHDLRTPLAAITGAGTLLLEDGGADPALRRELTATVVEEAERLERLVSNLLDMTRLESGVVEPRREWVPLVEVVGSAMNRVERALAERQVSIEIPDATPLLSIDPILVEQLFVNLLENAAKYTPPGSEISVRVAQEGGTLVVDVADRGPGIPAGEEERVFERFHRVAAPGVKGVGLGLPIARAIAHAHGGRLTAANRPGGGALFRLTLPILEPPPAAPAAAEPPAHGGREVGS